MNLFIYGEDIDAAGLISARNFELAERPCTVLIQRKITQVLILDLGHKLLYRPVWILPRFYLADKFEIVVIDLQAAMAPIDDLMATANWRRYYI